MSRTGAVLRLEPLRGLDMAGVDRIHETVQSALASAGVEGAVIMAALSVVEELCTNIMEHSGASWLELFLVAQEGGAHIELSDNGRPFDPCAAIRAQAPDLPATHANDRNLGLYMVQQLTAASQYSRDSQGLNQVVLEVRPGLEAPASPA